MVLDELIVAGELQEPSARRVLKAVQAADIEQKSEAINAAML